MCTWLLLAHPGDPGRLCSLNTPGWRQGRGRGETVADAGFEGDVWLERDGAEIALVELVGLKGCGYGGGGKGGKESRDEGEGLEGVNVVLGW